MTEINLVNSDDPFADIRPYRDEEVSTVIARLLESRDFHAALAKLQLPALYRVLPAVARWLVAWWLRRQLRNVTTVDQFQSLIKPQLQGLIGRTSRFSSEGLEKLSADESWLLISNHRDIVMDPSYTNQLIYDAGHRTMAIAIGDNLLREGWVADLMRINKSFIVRRNLSGPRELLRASQQLSAFVRSTITSNAGSVWIAQREGRAKTGIDKTEPAVIKMLSLSRDKQAETLSEVLNNLNIVPVAISYEIDPCDASKAAELASGPGYQKGDNEDVLSIGKGIAGEKGSVHLSFGSPIRGDDLTVDSVVSAIDEHMRTHYRLFENALWAWQRLNGTDQVPDISVYPGTITRQQFDARINDMPEGHRELALAMYANPLRRALGEI